MDPFLDYALWLTINELAEPWLAAVKSGEWTFVGREAQLEFGLKAVEPALASDVIGLLVARRPVPRDGTGPWIELIGASGRARELRQIFDQLVRGEFSEPAAVRALTALSQASRLRSVKPDGDLTVFAPLFDSSSEAVRIGALQLAGTWKLANFAARLAKAAGNPATSATERTAAFAALREVGGSSVAKELKPLAATSPSLEIRREAVVVLAGLDWPAALPEIMTLLKTTTAEAEVVALWRGLLGVRGAAGKLATELTKTGLPKAVALAGLRPARDGNQNQALVQTLMQLAGLKLSEVQLSSAELQALAREALLKGDASRGESVYRRAEIACVACHAVGGVGGKVGPDLTSIGASAPPDYLVESLLYPNAKVKEGYHSVQIATKDGQEINGMVVREGDTEVILRNAANQEVSVATKNIAKRTNVGSLMPAGLVDQLLPEERLDLVKFLSMLGKPGDFDAAKGGVARAWRLYLVTSKNQNVGIDPVVKGDFTLADWVPVSSLVSGALSKATITGAFAGFGGTRGLFAATQFESSKGGAVKLAFVGAAKEIWLNGRSVKMDAALTVETKPGVNTVVMQLDDTQLPAVLRLSSAEVSFLIH
jgi:putative heme-binding domain-containing protein